MAYVNAARVEVIELAPLREWLVQQEHEARRSRRGANPGTAMGSYSGQETAYREVRRLLDSFLIDQQEAPCPHAEACQTCDCDSQEAGRE